MKRKQAPEGDPISRRKDKRQRRPIPRFSQESVADEAKLKREKRQRLEITPKKVIRERLTSFSGNEHALSLGRFGLLGSEIGASILEFLDVSEVCALSPISHGFRHQCLLSLSRPRVVYGPLLRGENVIWKNLIESVPNAVAYLNSDSRLTDPVPEEWLRGNAPYPFCNVIDVSERTRSKQLVHSVFHVKSPRLESLSVLKPLQKYLSSIIGHVFPKLHTLAFRCGPGGVAFVGSLPILKHLAILECPATVEIAHSLCDALKCVHNLRHLCLGLEHNISVSRQQQSAFAKVLTARLPATIRYLWMNCNLEEHLSTLSARLPHLQFLSCSELSSPSGQPIRLGALRLETLRLFPRLATFKALWCDFTDFSDLMSDLQRLELEIRPDDPSLPPLVFCPNLTSLRLWYRYAEGAQVAVPALASAIAQLGRLTSLAHLTIQNIRLSRKSVQALSAVASLSHLELIQCHFGPRAFGDLAKALSCTAIRTLRLDVTPLPVKTMLQELAVLLECLKLHASALLYEFPRPRRGGNPERDRASELTRELDAWCEKMGGNPTLEVFYRRIPLHLTSDLILPWVVGSL